MIFEYNLDVNLNYICFGAGHAGRNFAKYIKEFHSELFLSIKYFCDESEYCDSIYNIPVVDIDELYKKYKKYDLSIIICIRTNTFLDSIISKLIKIGIPNSKISIIKCFDTIFSDYIIKKDFLKRKITAIDIGARENNRLSNLEFVLGNKNLTVYGFDPDEDECRRLSKLAKDQKKNYSYFPFALWSKKTDNLPLYIFLNNNQGSCFPIDKNFITRFVINADETIKKTISIKANTLDNILSENKIKLVDYIKINVDSAEYEVLQGCKKVLNNTKFVRVEVNVLEIFKSAKLFDKVSILLRENGFSILDFDKLYYLERKSSPILSSWNANKGALIQFDILAIKDPIKDSYKGWSFEDILTIIMLLEINGYTDFAFEIIIGYLKDLKDKDMIKYKIVNEIFQHGIESYGSLYGIDAKKIQYIIQ